MLNVTGFWGKDLSMKCSKDVPTVLIKLDLLLIQGGGGAPSIAVVDHHNSDNTTLISLIQPIISNTTNAL